MSRKTMRIISVLLAIAMVLSIAATIISALL